MSFNINNFIGNINRFGVLPTNKFDVEMSLPIALLSDIRNETARLIKMRADRINLPGLLHDVVVNKRYGIGPRQKTVSEVRYEPVSISFIETKNAEIFKLFYEWCRKCIGDHATNRPENPTYLFEYKEKYVTDINIHIYNDEITKVLTLKLFQAFPIAVGDNIFSWSQTNSITKLSVSFEYTHHQLLNDSTEKTQFYQERQLPTIRNIENIYKVINT